jgi:hypothetical protein
MYNLNVTEEEMGFSLNPLHDISSAVHAGERLAGKALHAGEKVAEDGAKDFAGAMKDAAKAVTHMSPSEIGHTVLNVAGMIPVIGTPADAINAGWYAAQGDWKNAALSAATAIPGVGDFVGGARLSTTALKLAEDGVEAERAIKGGEEVASTAENAEKALNADKTAGSAGVVKDGPEIPNAGKQAEDEVHGPYSYLEDSKSVGAGKKYTGAQKAKIYEANRARNNGVLRSDGSGIELEQPRKSAEGVTPPSNEAQVDHNYPRSKGGSNTYENARVLSRQENREKSDK